MGSTQPLAHNFSDTPLFTRPESMSSPSRPPLSNITNDASFSASPDRGKRHADTDDNDTVCKRLKMLQDPVDEMAIDEVQLRSCSSLYQQFRRPGFYGLRHDIRSGDAAARRAIAPQTDFFLRAFVSSDKADVYNCHSLDSTSLTPPYACSFSNASKQGRAHVLAVATEQGTVEILNTSRRARDWDPEPVRTTLPVHDNGIFDIKWSNTDRFFATASGDRTIAIVDPTSFNGTALIVLDAAQSGTIKCLDWEPTSENMLVSGSRDGCIRLWDLRCQNSNISQRWKPVIEIPYAHEKTPGKPTKNGRVVLRPRSITSVVFQPGRSDLVLSTGSGDGIVHKWDVRYVSGPDSPQKLTAVKPVESSNMDLTTLPSSDSCSGSYSPKRARGISSIAFGTGPSVGRIFALTEDSRIHTYNSLGAAGMPLDVPQPDHMYQHRHMLIRSFYVRLAVSPCGRWLACGGASGSAFVFNAASKPDVDVGTDARPGEDVKEGESVTGVELKAQDGEVGAVDWADDTLAACGDDGTVRLWRPDLERSETCKSDPNGAGFGWCLARP